jgi:hypothetical protein
MQVGWLGDGDDCWAVGRNVGSFVPRNFSPRLMAGWMPPDGMVRDYGRRGMIAPPLLVVLFDHFSGLGGQQTDRQMVTGPGNVACFQ